MAYEDLIQSFKQSNLPMPLIAAIYWRLLKKQRGSIKPGRAFPTSSRNIISRFGARNFKGMKYHYGVDIEGEYGAPAFAGVSGTVIDSYYDPILGYVVKVKDPSGRWIGEHHGLASEGLAPVGTQVEATDVVGYSGATESPSVSSGAHIHWGLFNVHSGQYVDPLKWLEGAY